MPLILDAGNYYIDRHGRRIQFPSGGIGLLDGQGGPLPSESPPHYIEWSTQALRLGIASNSAGESFTDWNGEELNGDTGQAST